MIATFLIETCLAIYVALKYPSSLFRTLIITLLLCLASFQLAEFQVCQGPDATKLDWTRFGLVGMTFLPALGMHLIGLVTRKSPLIGVGYLLATIYALAFMFVPGTTAEADCCGNYVMLNIENGWIGLIYDIYYSVFVLLAMMELALRIVGKGPVSDAGYSAKLVRLTLAGYLSFTVPMAIVAIISAEYRDATPSIMCGFAVILALILALFLAPRYATETEALRVGRAAALGT